MLRINLKKFNFYFQKFKWEKLLKMKIFFKNCGKAKKDLLE